jgi:hypothetical protein
MPCGYPLLFSIFFSDFPAPKARLKQIRDLIIFYLAGLFPYITFFHYPDLQRNLIDYIAFL